MAGGRPAYGQSTHVNVVTKIVAAKRVKNA